MIGRIFGKLTVVEKAPSITKRVRWICKCECGNVTSARADALISGDKKSCGCGQYYHRSLNEVILDAAAKATRTRNGCLEYSGRKTKNGYGKVKVVFDGKPKNELIHRVSAAVFLGYDLHDGRQTNRIVLHGCDNPPCFEGSHLFIGTYKDNTLDSVNKLRQSEIRKTHCPLGHPYTGDNLIIEKDGRRKCLACRRIKYPLKGRRVITHCRHGHEYTPDNTKLENGKRKCRTCLRNRNIQRWKINGQRWQRKYRRQ